MKYYETTFLKKDGTPRAIKFIKTEQIPLLTEGQRGRLGVSYNKDATPRKLEEGSQLVFDIEAKEFRVVNFNKLVSELIELEVKDE